MRSKPTKGNAPAASTAEASGSTPLNKSKESSVNSNVQSTGHASEKSNTVQLLPVLFHEDTLILVEHNAQPFVVMRPLVTAMGLDWASQFVKMGQKFGSVVVEITTTGADGKRYSMFCLPLRKLPGWLYSLNPGKVAPALRGKIVRYQNECDEVLWRHWTQQEPLHGGKRLSPGDSDRLMRRRGELRKELGSCTGLGIALDAFSDYQMVSALLGQRAGTLHDLAPGVRQQLLALEGGAA